MSRSCATRAVAVAGGRTGEDHRAAQGGRAVVEPDAVQQGRGDVDGLDEPGLPGGPRGQQAVDVLARRSGRARSRRPAGARCVRSRRARRRGRSRPERWAPAIAAPMRASMTCAWSARDGSMIASGVDTSGGSGSSSVLARRGRGRLRGARPGGRRVARVAQGARVDHHEPGRVQGVAHRAGEAGAGRREDLVGADGDAGGVRQGDRGARTDARRGRARLGEHVPEEPGLRTVRLGVGGGHVVVPAGHLAALAGVAQGAARAVVGPHVRRAGAGGDREPPVRGAGPGRDAPGGDQADRALAGQAPQGGGGQRGDVVPADPGHADEEDRGLVGRLRGGRQRIPARLSTRVSTAPRSTDARGRAGVSTVPAYGRTTLDPGGAAGYPCSVHIICTGGTPCPRGYRGTRTWVRPARSPRPPCVRSRPSTTASTCRCPTCRRPSRPSGRATPTSRWWPSRARSRAVSPRRSTASRAATRW